MPPSQVAPPPNFQVSPGQVSLVLPVMVEGLPFSSPIWPSMTGRFHTISPVSASRASTRPTTPNSPPDTPVMILPFTIIGAAV